MTFAVYVVFATPTVETLIRTRLFLQIARHKPNPATMRKRKNDTHTHFPTYPRGISRTSSQSQAPKRMQSPLSTRGAVHLPRHRFGYAWNTRVSCSGYCLSGLDTTARSSDGPQLVRYRGEKTSPLLNHHLLLKYSYENPHHPRSFFADNRQANNRF